MIHNSFIQKFVCFLSSVATLCLRLTTVCILLTISCFISACTTSSVHSSSKKDAPYNFYPKDPFQVLETQRIAKENRGSISTCPPVAYPHEYTCKMENLQTLPRGDLNRAEGGYFPPIKRDEWRPPLQQPYDYLGPPKYGKVPEKTPF